MLEDNCGLQTLTNSNVAYTTFNPTFNYVSINTHTKEEKDVIAQIKSAQEAEVSTVKSKLRPEGHQNLKVFLLLCVQLRWSIL